MVRSKRPAVQQSDRIESCIGSVPVPLGLARNFLIDGVKRDIPMATEERTVVAAASKGAKCALPHGFFTACLPAAMEVQIIYAQLPDPPAALAELSKRYVELQHRTAVLVAQHFRRCTGVHMNLPRFIGIPGDASSAYKPDTQVVVEIGIGTRDAMGANVVTRLGELVASEILWKVVGARPLAVICSNAEAGHLVTATATFTVPKGAEHRDRVLALHRSAQYDTKRAVTHNKGIMNAIDAIATATGNDTRAIAACVHRGADTGAGYRPLTEYVRGDGNRVSATLSLSLPVGTVGGATDQPCYQRNREIMGVDDAMTLARVMAAAGLAQNFAALLSLTDEGITEAHRRLSKRM